MAAPKKSSKKTAKKASTKKATAKKSTKKAAAKKTTKKAAAKKGAKKAAKKSTSGSREMLVSKSKVREALKGKDLRTDSNLFDALNEEIHDLLDRAARRAQDNKRSTVRPGDL